ncbi:fibronectin type III domain-containing protein [Yinghuangia sp. ASG 101]|uniref:fibronectin type III domain-containing protein n=1 Tax=Yinghuangia sp. ASG 101 TaxID=2896848 RepID=UPI001E415D5D|nr:fibronectin type III domain-containing protein [Yinghuangia sp. ASG 101]UGQ12291.1 fibronectin type III domain-containing protein [Yinghuangia sp. ASG 101]
MTAQSVHPVGGRFARWRPRRREVGWVALVVCVALIATSIVLGTGAAGAKVSLADLGNWLPSSQANTVVHVNGTTGQVDGRVELPGDAGGPLQVGTDGSTVLVLDQGTGTVSRIDPAQLAVPQIRSYGSDGLALAVGDGKAWLVNGPAGTVQPIDPVSLTPVSAPIDLGTKPLGPAGADNAGNLWVTLPATGQIVAVRGAVPSPPIPVAEPGHVLLLTIADGHPVVTDTTAGVTHVVGEDGPVRSINLPQAVAAAKPEAVRIPATGEGPMVPILDTSSGQLVVLNVNDGAVQAAPMTTPGSDFGAPEVLGVRVYIPDRTGGSLVVYDTAAASFAPSVRVTGVAGPLELDVRDGMLWANDQTQATAIVIDAQGTPYPVDKYKPDVPSDTGKPSPTATRTTPPTKTTSPTKPTSSPSGGPEPGPGGGDPASDSPEPSDPRDPPGRVEVPATTALPDPDPPKSPEPQVPPVVVTVTEHVPVVVPSPSSPPESPKPRPVETDDTPSRDQPPASDPAPDRTTSAPPPAPKPQPPGTPKAESGAGRITLVFAASPGARPERYTLDGLPKGAKATPGSVAPGGPFQFVVTGLSCADEYSFKVVAEFGATKVASGASTAVRPCVLVSAPTSLKTEVPRNGKGFTATWKAPANTGGSKVTYTVSWSGSGKASSGSTKTTETKATAKGLINGYAYNVKVTATNEVGTGPAATAVAKLKPPTRTYKVGPNTKDGNTLGVRSGPAVVGTSSVAQIPAGYTGEITVLCQTKGETVPRDYTSLKGDIWDKVTWKGKTGYTSDLYIRTPNSDAAKFSAELWECD